jgi:hypothetical protein
MELFLVLVLALRAAAPVFMRVQGSMHLLYLLQCHQAKTQRLAIGGALEEQAMEIRYAWTRATDAIPAKMQWQPGVSLDLDQPCREPALLVLK